ncbi:MAG TPA: 3-methyl-2-oxobutanoate hydroxymethyltransferase [Chloroflexota bacterium]|nr:3-methyl-2-oxobutanoate hydroxymethyltransferase [Chloroflexota bacterium]
MDTSGSNSRGATRVTAATFRRMKSRGERITMLTAYDYPSARLFDAAGVDALLVGDSLGMVVLGHETTVPVTVDDVIHHCRPVARGAQHALVVADLPFMSYTASREQALANAARLVQEGGAQAVKLEGGRAVAGTVESLVTAGVPVMGHIGLTPQSIFRFGGYRVQGRDRAAAQALLDDAKALEESGAFAIVLELVAAPVADRITELVKVPTIGIGAGAGCDGQIQVMHDVLGYDVPGGFLPKHARRFANVGETILEAVREYVSDVRAGTFPTEAQAFTMDESVLKALGD